MRRSQVLPFLLCGIIVVLALGTPSPAGGQVQVFPGHPRLIAGGYRGVSDGELQARCAAPSIAAECTRIGDYGHLLDLAMDWRLHGDPTAAQDAVTVLLSGIDCGNGYETTSLGGYALAYDWVWDYPGFSAPDKATVEGFIGDCTANIAQSLAGNSPHLWHGFTSQAAALALAALSLDADPRRDQALADAETYFRRTALEAFAYVDGAWPEGLSYQRTHFFSGDPPDQYVIDAVRAWHSAVERDDAVHEDILDTIRDEEGDWLRRLALFHIYALLPPYGAQTRHTWMRHGDMPTGQAEPNKQYRPYLDAIASEYAWPELQWLGQVMEADWGLVSGTGSYHSIHRYALPLDFDPSLASVPPDGLAPDALFGRDTIGYAFLRSGWEAEPRMIHLRAGDWFTGHQHMDQGHLEIWYRGPLAVDSGVYASWGTEHREAYYIRTVAHNAILVRRPGETFASAYGYGDVNDGGQRVHTYVSGAQTIQSVAEYLANIGAGRHYEAGDVTAFTSEAAFAHVGTDLTDAYNSDRYAWGANAAKVSAVERCLTYFRPEIVVLCDRVRATDPAFETASVLHGTAKPRTAAEVQIEGSPDDGILESTDGAYTIENATGGVLYASVLAPPEAVIRKVGGLGYRYYADGANRTAGASGLEGSPAEPGLWRVEVYDPVPRTDHVILQVMEITDSGAGAPAEASEVQMTQGAMAGAHVATLPLNRVALFAGAAAARPVSPPIAYTVSATAQALHVVADLEPLKSFRVTTPDGTVTRASDAEGVLFFTVTPAGDQDIFIEDGGCPAVLARIEGLKIRPDPGGYGAISWDPSPDAADGYHLYAVGRPADVPGAPAAGTLLCSEPQGAPPVGCFDPNPLAEPGGTVRFYQVVGVCGPDEGPV